MILSWCNNLVCCWNIKSLLLVNIFIFKQHDRGILHTHNTWLSILISLIFTIFVSWSIAQLFLLIPTKIKTPTVTTSLPLQSYEDLWGATTEKCQDHHVDGNRFGCLWLQLFLWKQLFQQLIIHTWLNCPPQQQYWLVCLLLGVFRWQLPWLCLQWCCTICFDTDKLIFCWRY